MTLLLAAAIAAPPNLYVKVPYQGVFDELVERKIVSGQFKVKLPRGMRIKNNQIQIQDGNTKEWFHHYALIADRCFGCHYDNNGNYYVPLALYKKLEKELIHRHQGRLERFSLPGTKVGDLNPKNFEMYIWDAEDKVWRWIWTLNRVPRDHKLKNGELLYKQKVDPKLKTGIIEELLKIR